MPADRSMAPPLPWLPDDLISEILSRTPVKSVCRFRCVSKGWRDLISDPAFTAAHRCPDHLLVASSSNGCSGKLEIKVMDMDSGNVLRVMDGTGTHWRLLAALDGSPYVDTSSGHVVDLATGEVLMACPPELGKRVRYLFTIGRAAARPSCAYKAVHVTRSRPHTCMVLTLGEEDAQWRPAPPPPFGASIRYSRSSVVTLNGVVHFLHGKDTPPHSQEAGDDGVLRFDLESETWKETIKGPPVAKPSDITATTTTRMTNLNGALCMIVTQIQSSKAAHDDDDRPRTDVWILADHGGAAGGWTKAYSIPVDPDVRLITPLKVMMNDGRKQLLFVCFVGRHRMVPVLRVYDPLAGETCTEATVKLPCNLVADIGLCTLHLKHAVLWRPALSDV